MAARAGSEGLRRPQAGAALRSGHLLHPRPVVRRGGRPVSAPSYADAMSAALAQGLSWRQSLTMRPRDWREALAGSGATCLAILPAHWLADAEVLPFGYLLSFTLGSLFLLLALWPPLFVWMRRRTPRPRVFRSMGDMARRRRRECPRPTPVPVEGSSGGLVSEHLRRVPNWKRLLPWPRLHGRDAACAAHV